MLLIESSVERKKEIRPSARVRIASASRDAAKKEQFRKVGLLEKKRSLKRKGEGAKKWRESGRTRSREASAALCSPPSSPLPPCSGNSCKQRFTRAQCGRMSDYSFNGTLVSTMGNDDFSGRQRRARGSAFTLSLLLGGCVRGLRSGTPSRGDRP